MVKDRGIDVIRLDGKARSRCSDKRLWSADEKKARIVWRQVDGWVGIVVVGSCLEDCPNGLE